MHRAIGPFRTIMTRCWSRIGLAISCLLLALPAAPPAVAADSELPPASVLIEGSQGRYRYLVDGVPTVIKGIGYNAIYHELPPEARLARLEYDFTMMQAVGINTLVSWYPAEFDHALLDVALAHDVGVIMPFDLPTTADYGDPTIQADMKQAILDWVESYRDHPAVRIWGIGNEVMLNMEADEAAAFAEFYADVLELVLAADPSRPVVYREAEDVFVPYLRDAMLARGGIPSGFVYGMNTYTPRLNQILDSWPQHGFDVPVMISEFAPAGTPRGGRSAGFRLMWETIRAHGDLVLGAAPYVWTTEGPEAVDRLFGFVDDGGRPVDDSLATLRDLYGGSGDLATVSAPIGVVPALVGLPEAEARQESANVGLGAVSVRYVAPDDADDPVLFRRLPPGVVVRQEPAPGTNGAGTPVTLIVTSPTGTPPEPVSTDRLLTDALDRAAGYAGAALGASADDVKASVASQREQGLHQQLAGIKADSEIDPRVAQIAELVAWSKVLSEVGVGGNLVFPGAREALPLLAGMSRWGFTDGESLDTAVRFLRDVLIRDISRAPRLENESISYA